MRAKSRPRRARATPRVMQMEAAECGAASLAIVLAHHGRHLTLEEVRAQCAVSRDGSSARNIVTAARANGMDVRARRLEPHHIDAAMLPAIAHWGMNHFLVVERIGDAAVRLNDPAEGPRTVTRAEFDRAFTGILLQMAPGPDFLRTGRRWSLAHAVAARMTGAREGVVLSLLLSLGLVVPGLLVPVFSQVLVDDVLGAGYHDWLKPLLIGMAACALLSGIMTWLQRETMLRIETRLANAGSVRLVEHLLRLPLGYFGQRHAGEISQRVTLVDRVAQLGAGDLGQALLALATALAYLVAMLFYAPSLAAVVVAFAALDGGLVAAQGWLMAADNRRLLVASGVASGVAKQGLRSIEAYKAAGQEDLLRRRLVGLNARVVNLRQRLGMTSTWLGGWSPFVTLACSAMVLTAGGAMVVGGQITLGALIAFQALMLGFLAPIGQLVQLVARTRDAEAYLRTLDDSLTHPLDPEFTAAAAPRAGMRRIAGAVEARALSFRHGPAAPPLLSGIDLAIAAGESIAIVGASGSGKSTLGRLLAGLIEPDEGQVLIDDVPLREVPRRLLRRSLAVVEQRGYLFGGTVRDNVTLWDDSMAEERVVRAARLALIHDVIVARPGGYGARLADGGTDLSGGQRQRLEIARAIALDPRILLLDEATSALDPATEAGVFANLATLGCTTIVIAHRFSAIRRCDRVIVLGGGGIVQQGQPDVLIRQPGPLLDLVGTA